MSNNSYALRRLHEAIAATAPIYGVSRSLEGTITITFADTATDEEKQAAHAIANNWVAPPEPQWQRFLADFKTPGENTLYTSVVTKVAAAEFIAQDHWRNFTDVINAHDIDALPPAVHHLAQLLSDAGQALSASDIDGWNTLIDSHDFPDNCKLPMA